MGRGRLESAGFAEDLEQAPGGIDYGPDAASYSPLGCPASKNYDEKVFLVVNLPSPDFVHCTALQATAAKSMHFVHSIDGRKHKRVPIVIVVRLLRVDDVLAKTEESTYTDNVSAHGARVISRHPSQPGEEVQVTSVKDGTAIRGKVVYCQQLEAGGFSLGLDFQENAVPWSSYAQSTPSTTA